MGRTALTALAVLLRVAAALSAATCLVWILGSVGTGVLQQAPSSVTDAARSFDIEASAGSPTFPVRIDDDEFDRLVRFDEMYNASDGYSVPGAFAEYHSRFFVTAYEPTLGQQALYVGLQCLFSLGVAWLWWGLARLVASARDGDPFTVANVGRLRAIGWLVLVGGPAYVVSMWLAHRWLLSTSELAGAAAVLPLSWREIPWWSVGVGLAVLVVAAVWRRGVTMRHEVEGLV